MLFQRQHKHQHSLQSACRFTLLLQQDLGMQYATALLGLSIGPPLLNALTVIIGVVLAYFLDGGINKQQLVFPGMVS
jgi:hypothetical protein